MLFCRLFLLIFAIICLILETLALTQNFSIREEQDVNSYVGSLSSQLQANVIQYATLQSNEDGSDLFSVNKNTGQIHTAKRIDREQICPTSLRPTQSEYGAKINRDGDCYVTFKVNAIGDGNKLITAITVIVIIEDINDNGCEFVPSTQQEHINENENTETARIRINLPKDPDSEKKGNGIDWNNVRLIENEYFALSRDHLVNFGKGQQLYLVLKKPLDYEQVQKIDLKVEAGSGDKTCQLNVEISVNDVNDHSPRFSKERYPMIRLKEQENLNFDREIFKVQAYDADSGENGRIIYEIDSNNFPDAAAYFTVESNTGRILLRRKLNHKEVSRFDFIVTARNPGARSIKDIASTQIQFEVEDINDHAPLIRVSSINGLSVLTVLEESNFPQDIGLISVSDEDSGDNARISCHLENITPQNIINLEPISVLDGKQFKIVLTNKVDREINSHIDFSIFCEDFGTEPKKQTSTQFVRINVDDINDNAPQFNKSMFSIKVLEDNAPERAAQNFTILHLIAQDKDLGRNAKLRYSIVDTPIDINNLIHIDPDTGVIRSHGNLDREHFSELNFQVEARDQGDDHKASKTSVNLKILDYNDNAPQFDSKNNSYFFIISENSPRDAFVGTIRVQDFDIGENAKLKVTFDEDTDPANHIVFMSNSPNNHVRNYDYQISRIPWSKRASFYFHLTSENVYNQNMTEIKLRVTGSPNILDRESFYQKQGSSRNEYISSITDSSLGTDPVMEFKLVATDQGRPSKKSYATIRVKIQDQNDNNPVWKFPTKQSISSVQSVNVSAREAIGFLFAKLSAYDPDSRENGTITYYIQSGNSGDLFKLNPVTGGLTVSRSLSNSGYGKHLLDLRAVDGGDDHRYEDAQLMIIVDDSEPKAANDPFYDPNNPDSRRINLFIIIAIIVASFIISAVLLTSICLVLRKARQDNNRNSRYCYSNGDHGRSTVDGLGNPIMDINIGSVYGKGPAYSTMGLLTESPPNAIYQPIPQDTYAINAYGGGYVSYVPGAEDVAYSSEVGYYNSHVGPGTNFIPVSAAYTIATHENNKLTPTNALNHDYNEITAGSTVAFIPTKQQQQRPTMAIYSPLALSNLDEGIPNKRNSFANSSSNDRDSGNGDSVDVNNPNSQTQQILPPSSTYQQYMAPNGTHLVYSSSGESKIAPNGYMVIGSNSSVNQTPSNNQLVLCSTDSAPRGLCPTYATISKPSNGTTSNLTSFV